MTVVIRADASAEIGTGHVMRCIALAQALCRLGVPTLFVTSTAENSLLARLRREVREVVTLDGVRGTGEANFTASMAGSRSAQWIVLDGYKFDADYVAALKACGFRVLFVDDLGNAPVHCDIVLNQNLHALDAPYENGEHQTLLLGPTYALLREEFVQAPLMDVERASLEHPRVLVTLGGADPHGCTLKVLNALAALPLEGTELRVIMGPAFEDKDAIRECVAGLEVPTQLLTGVESMVEHMLWADRCIVAGGSTCWECCRLAVSMAVGIIAPNQVEVASSIERHNLGIDLGWLTTESTESLRERLRVWFSDVRALRRAAKAASRWVDGGGAERVAKVLVDHPSTSACAGGPSKVQTASQR